MAIIIAECSHNHNGDIGILKDMIWSAAEAGADYIKIQSMRSDELMFRDRFEHGEIVNGITRVIKRPYHNENAWLSRLELSDDDHRTFVDECRKVQIKPLTTVYTLNRIRFLSSLGLDAIKVSSYDCASFPMIVDLKHHFDHLIISTGASFDEEIQHTANILNGHLFSLMHCISIYPTPLNRLNLARIKWLRRFTPSVGFCDHTLTALDGLKASVAALYLGADIVERHFSILSAEKTVDGPVSIDQQQLRQLVEFAKMPNKDRGDYLRRQVPEFEEMIGVPTRDLSHTELLNRDYYRGRFASRKGDRLFYNWEEA